MEERRAGGCAGCRVAPSAVVPADHASTSAPIGPLFESIRVL